MKSAAIIIVTLLCLTSSAYFGFEAFQQYAYERDYENERSWIRSGHNNLSDKYTPLDQINKSNLSELQVAWTHNSGSVGNASYTVQTNPIFSSRENLLYISSPCCVIAINPKNGSELWRLELPSPVAKRGLTYDDQKLLVQLPVVSMLWMLPKALCLKDLAKAELLESKCLWCLLS